MCNTVHNILFGGNMQNHNNVVNLLIEIQMCQYVWCYVHSPCSLTTISKDTSSCRHRTREDSHIIVCIGQSRHSWAFQDQGRPPRTKIILNNHVSVQSSERMLPYRSEHCLSGLNKPHLTSALDTRLLWKIRKTHRGWNKHTHPWIWLNPVWKSASELLTWDQLLNLRNVKAKWRASFYHQWTGHYTQASCLSLAEWVSTCSIEDKLSLLTQHSP